MAIERKVKPVVLDETVRGMNQTLEAIKGILNDKMFTPSVIVSGKEITENGTYDAATDNADGYDHLIVNVSGSGGTMGALTAGSGGTYFPSDYDLDGFNKVIVNMYEEESKTLTLSQGTQTLTPGTGYTSMKEVTVMVPLQKVSDGTASAGTITTNGTYNLSSGKLGFEPFIVNVSGGTGGNVAPKPDIITSNNTYNASDDGLDGYTSVVVSVPQEGGITFDSVMTKAFAKATVPTSWEIPTTVTSIPSKMKTEDGSYNYEYRDDLLDDIQKLSSVTLASGHTGMSRIGEYSFANISNLTDISFSNGAIVESYAFSNCGIETITSANVLFFEANKATGEYSEKHFMGNNSLVSADLSNFTFEQIEVTIDNQILNYNGFLMDCSNLETVTNFPEIKSNDDISLIPSNCFSNTAISSFSTKNHAPIGFLCENCFSGLTSGTFESSDITNEDYLVDEMDGPVVKYIFYNSVQDARYTTRIAPESEWNENYFNNVVDVYNEDGTQYVFKDKFDPSSVGEVFFTKYFDDSEMKFKYRLISLTAFSETNKAEYESYDESTGLYRFSIGSAGIYTRVAPRGGEGSNVFDNPVTLYTSDGEEYDISNAAVVYFVDSHLWRFEYDSDAGGYVIKGYRPENQYSYMEYEGNNIRTGGSSGQFSYSNISSINLPNLVKVAMYMFSWCSSIETLNFPNVTRVADNGFANIEMLKTVYLPKCEYMSVYAFENDNQLTDIYLLSVTKVTEIKQETFDGLWGVSDKVKIHLPSQAMKDLFEDDPNWHYAIENQNIELVVGE